MRTSTVKSIAALALTGASTALVLGFKTTDGLGMDTAALGGTGTTTTSTTTSDASTPGTGTGSSSTSSPTSSPSSSSSASDSTSTAAYADGTWTGNAVTEPWGKFQVAIVISGGEITDVNVVRSPSDRKSTSINSRAVPVLTESVLASQGTSVDMVSGATWTSESYTTSLQSALDKAAAA